MKVRPLTPEQRAGLRAICFEVCPRCHGTGEERHAALRRGGGQEVRRSTCSRCGSSGKLRHGKPIP